MVHHPDQKESREYLAQSSLIAHRPDIQDAVTAFDTIRTHIAPDANLRQPFPDVLRTIEDNLSKLIAEGKDIPFQQQAEL